MIWTPSLEVSLGRIEPLLLAVAAQIIKQVVVKLLRQHHEPPSPRLREAAEQCYDLALLHTKDDIIEDVCVVLVICYCSSNTPEKAQKVLEEALENWWKFSYVLWGLLVWVEGNFGGGGERGKQVSYSDD